ncbi:1-deoxy-D-xylulose 5-phosphate reductoisomerase [Candidatus Desulfarcum epimagneticum]|uniref:1-deoxy-D-xylulose 5-phosphate reductoisomerase n=1 Tax=uncultured Desulfobacteraceae bacterium TaxID=218296 RepID=A0A484HH53_9BACT|nr:1-deoxy-D-xylulose 5-phosphate reductoisomerase [uncultured Desulfobacteraceae bacterium]
MTKNLSILGSTGSIGRNTLAVAGRFPERFRVRALAAKGNISLLARQIERFRPDAAAVFDEENARALEKTIPGGVGTKILWGPDGYAEAAAFPKTDMTLSAFSGAAGLSPTLAAIEAGKDIALANKETLVMAGEIVLKAARESRAAILPVDSEHSAIFQCLEGQRRKDLEKIILTASGGPFWNRPDVDFSRIRPEDALAHPTWSMGKKISVDSATLMNKALEAVEAMRLFHLSHDQIEILIHPQSIVHSMAAYIDGSVMAQMGVPDMKTAIAYALSYPKRLPLRQPLPDFALLKSLEFEKPDPKRFPSLDFAKEACEKGGSLPAVMNAANESAVAAFLEGRALFSDIFAIIETVMARHLPIPDPSLSDILEADAWARETADHFIAHAGQNPKKKKIDAS